MNDVGGDGDHGVGVLAASIVGMRERRARWRVMRAGLRFRVVRRDGVDLILTADRRSDRVNAVVDNGSVIESRVG